MQTGGFTHDFPIFTVGAAISRLPSHLARVPPSSVQAQASPNARMALGEALAGAFGEGAPAAQARADVGISPYSAVAA